MACSQWTSLPRLAKFQKPLQLQETFAADWKVLPSLMALSGRRRRGVSNLQPWYLRELPLSLSLANGV